MTKAIQQNEPGEAAHAPVAEPPVVTPQASAPPGTTAILVATAAAEEGGPAAALEWPGGTLLSRLIGQLAWLGIDDLHVITRPEHADAIAMSAAGARIHECTGPPDDLRTVAELARSSAGPLVVGLAEVVTQHQGLAALVADPRAPTGILTMRSGRGRPLTGRPFSFRTRSMRGRVESSASPYHSVRWPTHRFLGLLKVAPADLPVLADAAERLASLTEAPPPEWQRELQLKARRWRRQLASRRLEEQEDESVGAGDRPEQLHDDEDDEIYDHEGVLPPEIEREVERRHAVVGDDVTALLLVGLVRARVPVKDVYARWFYWARPLSAEGVEWARAKIDAQDEDRALLASAVKPQDGFFTTFFVSPYSQFIARWAARRGFTPNQVTTVSLLIGFVAAAAFATGERWGLIAGAVLLQIAFTTDCVDGQLARYTRTFSQLGAWLDSIFDRTKEYAVFAGLAIGASRMADPVWLLASAALILQTVRHTMDFSFAVIRQAKTEARPPQALEEISDGIGPWRPRKPPPPDAVKPKRPPKPLRKRLASRLLARSRELDEHPVASWVKRMVIFPIGERFAVISLTAALFTPRVTFIAMLAWGGFAASYATAGRVLRSVR